MLSKEERFLLAAIVVVILWVLLGAAQQPKVEKFGDEWFYVRHESGYEYLLKRDQVNGFIDPYPGDPKDRGAVLIQGGHALITGIDMDEFVDILVDAKIATEEDKKELDVK